MHEQVERFRRQVARHFGGPPGKGARYSAELRAEAVALAQAAVERGESLRSIAAGLGIGSVTLARWLEAPAKTEWRAVEIVEEPDREIVASPGLPGLVLITARGHRLEGLGFDEAVLLLEALG
jgi:hypothetical protein